ncbi:MBL fold metallo-hydrolase [Flavonifractor plautii]|nr:MBL fold metallo-hydrolase [Flavonifractor plautii]
MLELCTLASGSSGNSLLVTDGRTHVLVDAGISCRRICTGLKELGVEPTELAGVLITHEHSDHISGLTTLTKQLRLPVYASPGTGRQLCYRIAFLEELLRPVAPGRAFPSAGWRLRASPPPTTRRRAWATPCPPGAEGGGGHRPGLCDRGGASRHPGADLLVAEANHDVEWVQSGPYPYHLKARILGDRGHLSNEAGAELAWTAVEGARTVVLAHLSHENNTPPGPEVVRGVLERRGAAVGRDVALEVAPAARRAGGTRYEGHPGAAHLRGQDEGEILHRCGGGVRQAPVGLL